MDPAARTIGEEILAWLLLVVKLGVTVAIFVYGINEYRRWARRQKL